MHAARHPLRRRRTGRGVVAGRRMNVIVHWRKQTRCIVLTVVLKSPKERCSTAQREAREKFLRAGVIWRHARSAKAALVAIVGSGRRFAGRSSTRTRGEALDAATISGLVPLRSCSAAAMATPRRGKSDAPRPATEASAAERLPGGGVMSSREKTSRRCPTPLDTHAPRRVNGGA